jgi:peptidoglycan hydrolase-like protein with peptidoglycan-binding domain
VTRMEDANTIPPISDTVADGEEPDHGDPRVDVSGRRHKRVVGLGLGGAVLAAAGAGVGLWAANTSSEDTTAASGAEATATVEVGTISATESWDGTLERGRPFTVKSSAKGTITRIAAQGAAVGRGAVLFRVDEQPVTLLSGVVPMYRDLRPGQAGADVEQLEANLTDLGYVGFTVDQEYTQSTAEAVRAWQDDVGAAATGTVARGAVVFAPEGGRVDTLRSQVGDVVAPGTAVLDITGADQVVDVEVDVDDLDRFPVDTLVSVLLPGGEEVTGAVSATTVVEATPQAAAGMSGDESSTDTESIVQVEIALDKNAPDQLVGAPVGVVVAVDERTDVLLVPVNALLALAEGGYGLEVVADDGTTSIVPVETGLFGQGKVEVTSPDIAEGTVVGVAGR